MAEKKIDYDRGVIFQNEPKSGMMVYMYVDTPGEYINAYGVKIPDAVARAAGFDIDLYGKQKLRRERMAAAKNAIEHEIALANERVKEPVKEHEGWKVYNLGAGQFSVEDPEGNTLNTIPLPEPVALVLFDQLTGLGEKKEEEKPDLKSKK